MSTVGVRELKKRLSEYLELASKGEPVIVTDRGRPKALLGPLPGRARIEEGVANGWIVTGSGAPLSQTKRWKGARPSHEALDEDRGA